MHFEQLSANITDLPGVEGLCLMDQEQSTLLFKKMPAFFPDAAFDEAVRRIVALYETVDENFLPADDYVLRFQDKMLLLRRASGCILTILAAPETNQASLRMVSNMTLRHLQTNPALLGELRASSQKKQPELASTPPLTPPASPSPAVTLPNQAAILPAPVAAPKARRMYRGQLIID